MSLGIPRITVLMATFNQSEYIAAALESVLNQTVDPEKVQIIVVDDGSNDRTDDILRRFSSHITVLGREHRGLVDSCNAGLERAEGDYIVRVDSDDTVHPSMLERELDVLEKNVAVLAYSDRTEEFVGSGELLHVVVDEHNLYDLIACGVMMRTSLLRSVGGYRRLFWEEYDLFLRLRQEGRFLHIPELLYNYRRHRANMTNRSEVRLDGWRELLRLWGPRALSGAGFHEELKEAIRLEQRREIFS